MPLEIGLKVLREAAVSYRLTRGSVYNVAGIDSFPECRDLGHADRELH